MALESEDVLMGMQEDFQRDVQKPPENAAGRINGISYAARHVYNCHTRGQQSHGGRAWPIMAGVRRAPRILDRHM